MKGIKEIKGIKEMKGIIVTLHVRRFSVAWS
jgi:hypothetical protein